LSHDSPFWSAESAFWLFDRIVGRKCDHRNRAENGNSNLMMHF
jgi:hypothetical protein